MDLSSRSYGQDYFAMAMEYGVIEGLAPFRVKGPVNFFQDYDIDFIKDRLVVELPEMELYARTEIDRDLFLDDPRVAADRMGRDILLALRYRPIEPIPSNIILGDN